MSKKKNTIIDVAKKLGVSPSTVSRALQDHPTISDKTKKLVRKTVDELNYSPNNVAASLRRGKVNSIGVIIPKINSTFMSNCIFGIESVTYPSGYNLIICQSNENYEKEIHNIRTLIDSQVSGIMLSLSNETIDTKHLQNVIDKNIPLVMFDRVDESLGVDCIVNDDTEISKEVVVHFANQGYKKIAFISGPIHIYVYKNRLDGYLKGLNKLDLEKREEWIIKGIQTKQEAYEATKKLFKSSNPPDAIFCTGDTIAHGAIQAIESMGLNVPNDVGVVGYSNDIFSEIINPPLSSVEQFPKDIGANAARIMLDLLKQEDTLQQVRKMIFVKPSLLVRKSSDKKLK
jgi:DNA-binding LacI/PurR family transcriptional regulator